MPNGKCRLYGGRSSGPGNVLFPEAGGRTGERKLRNKLAAWPNALGLKKRKALNVRSRAPALNYSGPRFRGLLRRSLFSALTYEKASQR